MRIPRNFRIAFDECPIRAISLGATEHSEKQIGRERIPPAEWRPKEDSNLRPTA